MGAYETPPGVHSVPVKSLYSMVGMRRHIRTNITHLVLT